MFLGNESSFSTGSASSSAEAFPPNIELLYRLEREIAVIVYRRGLVTASDVQEELSKALSNPAIRSMLNRLVKKGVLTRMRCGPYGTFVYAPAVTPTSARETALRQFAQDFYAGSLQSLADAIADLFAGQRESHLSEKTH